MIDQMVIYFTGNHNIYGGIGLTRFAGEKPFTQRDKDIVQTLYIHLQQLIKKTMVIEEYEAKNLFLNEGNSDEIGIIKINKNRNISFYNEFAQSIINKIEPDLTVERFFQISIYPEISNYITTKKKPFTININNWSIKIIPQKKYKRNLSSKNYSIYLYPCKENLNDNNLETLFTKRELEIFNFVIKGYTNEQVSTALWISINTVKKHLRNMYEKLGVSNRTGLIYKSSKWHTIN